MVAAAVAVAKVTQDPVRPPLIPSEKDNAAFSRRPKKKEITSRYLNTSSPSSSSSNTTTSNSSCSSSSSSRRFPSPLASSAARYSPQTPSRRSQSVDRARPSTPRHDSRPSTPNAAGAQSLFTTTRSLSVSFQGESFFYQTSRAKTASPSPARKRAAATSTPSKPLDHSDNSKPFNSHHHHRWPAASQKRLSNPLTRSMDCSPVEKEEPMEVLSHRVAFKEAPRNASFDTCDLSALSDTDSVSSGSNSGTRETRMQVPWTPQSGTHVPSKFWQESGIRHCGLPQHNPQVSQKLIPSSTPFVDSPMSFPRGFASQMHQPARAMSPGKFSGSPCRGVSPMRSRNVIAKSLNVAGAGQQIANAPSILSFATEVRRARKGENRIEEAHILRLIHNRQLQWQLVNARTNSALLEQKLTAEKNVYNAWIAMSELYGSVTVKKIQLNLLSQSMKLASILSGQLSYLEEWSLLDREHMSSLLGSIDALRASILRLPIVCGTRADVQEVKDAVGSAVDVMQAMGSSICFLLSKVEAATSVLVELAKVVEEEKQLLSQSRNLLSTVAALHVKQCSLRGHVLQLRHKSTRT